MEFYVSISKGLSVDSAQDCALLQNPQPLKLRSIASRLSIAISPARGEIGVENGDSRSFQSPFRDVMWVLYASRYPHHVPTGLGRTSRLLFSTRWYKSLTCTNIFASLTHTQRKNIEQLHVRDVLILVQVWRLVPAPAPNLIQPIRLNLIAPPTHSHEN